MADFMTPTNRPSHREALEIAAQEYSKHPKFNGTNKIDLTCAMLDFKAGADWQAEQDKARIEKLERALRFYADGEGDVLDWDRVNNPACLQDRGRVARKALERP